MRDINEIVKEMNVTLRSKNYERNALCLNTLNTILDVFTTEDGVRTIWLENGMSYIAHGYAIRETDSPEAKAVIDELQHFGIDFEEG